MPGSSLRNAVKGRSHRERGQLAHRSKFGLLEKKKDYVLRAQNYHSKQNTLRRLREKAATRNKDEFYFAMTKQRTERGVHVVESPNQPIPIDAAKLLKSQDEKYIRTMRSSNLKKIEAVKSELKTLVNLLQSHSTTRDEHFEDLDDDFIGDLTEAQTQTLCDAGLLPNKTPTDRQTSQSSGRHIIFVESEHHAKLYQPPDALNLQPLSSHQTEETEEADLGWVNEENAIPRKQRQGEGGQEFVSDELSEELVDAQQEEAKIHRDALIHELKERVSRERSLKYALLEQQNKRLLMSNGARRRIDSSQRKGGGDESEEEEDGEDRKEWKPKIYKWRFERKK